MNKNKEEKFDNLMKKALASNMEPDEELNRSIVRSWKECPDMKRNKKRIQVAATAAACVMVLSVTVGAAVKYMSSAEIAEKSGNEDSIHAFKGKGAVEINQSQETSEYRITFLGIATGAAMIGSGLSDETTNPEKTYATIAVEKLDGTPMPAAGESTFFMSPLIQGLKPWQYNIASMGGGYSEIVEKGVLYRLIECDEIAKFADKSLYLCVSSTDFYDKNAYNYNEATGEISRNETFDGINLLFDLPLDASNANPEEAADYVKAMEASMNEPVTKEEEKTEKTKAAEQIATEMTEAFKKGNMDDV